MSNTDDNVAIGGTLGVAGKTTLAGALALAGAAVLAAALSVGTTLLVTGVATFTAVTVFSAGAQFPTVVFGSLVDASTVGIGTTIYCATGNGGLPGLLVSDGTNWIAGDGVTAAET